MATKYCISCGREIEEDAVFCPKCGANQAPNYNNPNQPYYQYNYPQSNKMSTNKTLSFVALGAAIVSIVFGGLLAEIAAIIISIIVLKSNEPCEPEAKTIAKIALIVSIVLMVVRIAILVIFSSIFVNMYVEIFDSFRKIYN